MRRAKFSTLQTKSSTKCALRTAICTVSSRQFSRSMRGWSLGGVRDPLPALIESDMAIVEEAAKMVRDAKAKYLA